MTYNKVSNKSQDKDVKYINKDYNSFKNNLMEFAEIYFPNNFNDFSEGNPGMMFLEMASYVGDVLSFYTDTQLRESIKTFIKLKNNTHLDDPLNIRAKLAISTVVTLLNKEFRD